MMLNKSEHGAQLPLEVCKQLLRVAVLGIDVKRACRERVRFGHVTRRLCCQRAVHERLEALGSHTLRRGKSSAS